MEGFHLPEAMPPEGRNPPSVNLWIGNLSPDVTEAELKALLDKYGKVYSITSYASRNYAFVYFNSVEDAKSAKDGLQGHLLRGIPLKIEFAKPAKPSKSLWVAGISPTITKDEFEKKFQRFGKIQDFRFLKDPSTAFVDYVRLEDSVEALKNMNGKIFGGSQIRVDYLRPLSSRKQPLPIGSQLADSFVSNMLLIRHPSSVVIDEDMLRRTMILFGEIQKIKTLNDGCALVEFRSAEEAKRAKDGLQGRLFNDPQISIEYIITEFPGARGLVGEYPIQSAQMDMIGLNRPASQGNNPGLLPLGIAEPDIYAQPPHLIPYGAFNQSVRGQEIMDFPAAHKLQTSSSQNLIGEANWRSSSHSQGMPTSIIKPVFNVPKPLSGAWDAPDATSLVSRDSKRARFEGPIIASGVVENHHVGSDSLITSEVISPSGSGGGLRKKRRAEGDCIWRGLIAKGGTPVCRARCVAIGEGLDADIPKVVNCSARTGLDLLTKHYEEALGFDVVLFLPDSEDDFGSYTEFLRYLGSKDRAGVAKLDDGTTMFLVPPSSFLFKVLKVSGPERLYGVVLKFSPPVLAPPPHHHLPDQQTRHGPFPAAEARSRPPPTAAASQVGLALTPELIATLTSLRANPPPIANPPPPKLGGWQHEQNNGEAAQHQVGTAPAAAAAYSRRFDEQGYLPRSHEAVGQQQLGDDIQRSAAAALHPPVGGSESEVDKNERYKSTLAFAANLLSQIQQQQQQATKQHP